MSQKVKAADAAIGFRVKSGWAAAVLLAGPADAPRALDRRVIELCDAAVPHSKQPYHAAMELSEEEGAKVVEQLRRVVQRVTQQSVTELLKDYGNTGHSMRGAGVVVGSDIDPARIANAHIRAHALEGRFFRTILEEALQACGLRCLVVVERAAYAKAAATLGRQEAELKRLVAELGRALGGPWRTDEKTATLAAWMALA